MDLGCLDSASEKREETRAPNQHASRQSKVTQPSKNSKKGAAKHREPTSKSKSRRGDFFKQKSSKASSNSQYQHGRNETFKDGHLQSIDIFKTNHGVALTQYQQLTTQNMSSLQRLPNSLPTFQSYQFSEMYSNFNPTYSSAHHLGNYHI